jgi:nitrite reductase/ring-hydroxylating ferredoxin subunit
MNEDLAGRRSAMRMLAGWWAWVVTLSSQPLPGWSATPLHGLTRLAKLSDIPDGTVLRTVFRGEPLLLLNEGGTVRALSGLCTHESCKLGWNDVQHLIQCPCHGSMFDSSGQVVKGPATEALPAFRTELRRGWVLVAG